MTSGKLHSVMSNCIVLVLKYFSVGQVLRNNYVTGC